MMSSEKLVACGMSGRLPESDSLEEFWNHLINKNDMVSRDGRRWDPEFLGLPKGSGMLKDVSRFDASYFGMLPKQVNKTDPQLRILLEVAYEAIVDAGFNPKELKGSNTGVFVASSYNEANIVFCGDMNATDGYGYTGCVPAFLSNRISYVFDLKGPSYTADAACAAGLLVMHLAMRAILNGECNYALVGGVTVNIRPQMTYTLSQLNVLAPDGISKTFDQSADGFSRADAVVALFITRESLCRRAYSYLIHSVTNHCGYVKQGISYPSLEAQANLLQKAYSESGISTDDVGYIETHGTGTIAGDPIEANAIHKIFCQNRQNPLLIGSVKTNMGHSECTAGLVSLVKVLLSFNHGVIPPNLHFTNPKSSIVGFKDGTLKVVTEQTKYTGYPVGINCFGFGGVNVHVILKPCNVSSQNVPCAIPRILISSGRTKDCVKDNLIYQSVNMVDGAFHRMTTEVADCPDQSMPYRGYKILNGESSTEEVKKLDKSVDRPIWLIFTGMGSQWPGMGKDLMVLETFRETILTCHRVLQALDPNIELMDLIMNGTKEKIDETIAAFVTTISIQVALVNCLKDLGIKPDGIIGHSMGETACAFADGHLTEEQTIKAIYWRGRCVLNGNPPPGLMASVGLGWEEAKTRAPKGVIAACQNSEDNTTISGNTTAIRNFVSELESEGVFARIVNTKEIAYHSPDMFPIAPALQTALDEIITDRTPISTSWISTSVPDDQTKKETTMFNSSYLVKNLISQVRFYDAVRKVPANAIVLEIAPHGLMRALLKRSLSKNCEYISFMSRKEEDNLQFFLSNIGKMFTLGVSLDIMKLYPSIQYPVGVGIPMLSPGIKWDHSIQWVVPSWEEFTTDRSVTSKEIDVVGGGVDAFITDHNIDGRVLYPATGYIVIAWRAIATMLQSLPENLAIDFSNITIHRATVIDKSKNVTFKVRIIPSANLFYVSENDEVAVSGNYSIPDQPYIPGHGDLNEDKDSFTLRQEDIYKELRLIGYNYGPKFQGLKRSTIDGSRAVLEWNGNWITFLDTMLQAIIIGKENRSRCLYLPTRIRLLRINPKLHMQITGLKPPVEVLVAVDRTINTCCSGGVEVTGLHTSMAPKRHIKQTPTLEYVQFVPYGKRTLSIQKDVFEYARICREYVPKLLSKLSSTYTNESLQGIEVDTIDKPSQNTTVDSYLNDDKCGFIKVLHEVLQLKERCDDVKEVWSIIDSNALQLTNDMFWSYLPKSNSFRNLLDVVWENSVTRKIRAVELGARYGGLFTHAVNCLMSSHPLLELEFIATDANVKELCEAFKGQINTLKVSTSQYDVNEEGTNGLSHVNLVTVRGLAQQSKNVLKSLQNIHSMLTDGGFLLLLEVTSNFDIHLAFDSIVRINSPEDSHIGMYLKCEEWEGHIKKSGFELIQQVTAFSSTLFLCRKTKRGDCENKDIFISVSGNEFAWVEEVKNELSNLQIQESAGNIWLISENDYSSGIIGMVNCLRQEDGGERIRCVFNAADKSELSDTATEMKFMKQLVQTDLVMNVLKDGLWGSYRHQFLSKDGFAVETQNAYVDILSRGDLSSFQWIQAPIPPSTMTSNDVTCTVNYSSLNFRDVMLASGKLPAGSIPDDLAHRECLVGMEFSGRDPHGRRVMGIVANQGIATHVTVGSDFLVEIPESWSLEEAATVPVVYTTVYYALVVRGQIKRGESILIHSGSGGVGQAAIAVALSYGCEIFTTVGTDEKRKFLMEKFPSLPDSCFASSRNLSFENHIMKQTDGKGVNLVLNSLSGEMLEASLRCLSMNGRFLEIGKYDLSQNTKIGLSIFLNNTAFHGIHLDRLFQRGNSDWSIIANLMKEGIRDGVVQPLPRTLFAKTEVEKAFRYMAKGKHIGKILIEVRCEQEGKTPSPKHLTVKVRHSCHPSKVFIVLGGLGGFGLELADWLVTRGCKKLVLTSRTGVRSGYQAKCLSRWLGQGVTVNISTFDISEDEGCRKLLRQSQQMGPIGGIFNLAMILKDGFLDNLTAQDFVEVCKPKITAAKKLDQATRQLCGSELEWFVMFSSITSGRGNGGQTNYGYANSAMERLCENRRIDQLPGLAIQWGVIGDVGVVAESATGNDTVIGGCAAQTLKSCLSTLDIFLSCPHPVLSSFVKASRDEQSLTQSQQIDIHQFVATFFGIEDVSSVSWDVPLADIGLDSLMAVEVKQTLERNYSAVLSMREIRALTLRKLLTQFGKQSLPSARENDQGSPATRAESLPMISPIISFIEKICLVKLNAGKSGNQPIFLIHPIEGTIDVFKLLVAKLSNYPVFALQVTKDVPNGSINEMARHYLSHMQSVQPGGPYNIVGYSFGAVVAIEIAHLLYKKKSKPKLILLDASPSFAHSRVKLMLETQYILDQREIDIIGQRGAFELRTLVYFIQLFMKIPFYQIKRDLMEKHNYQDRLHLIVSKLLGAINNSRREDLTFSVDSFVKRTSALMYYQPPHSLPIDVVLLKAKTCSREIMKLVESEDYNLSKICNGQVKIDMIDGDHESILLEPGVEQVASIMKTVF